MPGESPWRKNEKARRDRDTAEHYVHRLELLVEATRHELTLRAQRRVEDSEGGAVSSSTRQQALGRFSLPAVPEDQRCHLDYDSGLAVCSHRVKAPWRDCRQGWCPHVVEMRTRNAQRFLRQYAPGLNLYDERLYLPLDTAEGTE